MPSSNSISSSSSSSNITPIFLTFVLGFALLVIYYLFVRRQKQRSTVLLVGPSGSGKTTLFLQLRDGSAHLGTVASMQENEADIAVLSSKAKPLGSLHLVDVPGHPRLTHTLERYLATASAVIFVLDSTDVSPHRSEAAEALFEVLAHPQITRRRTKVLVLCNKSDLELQAHSVEFVIRTLEKQLEAMRRTRATLAAAGDSAALRESNIKELPNAVPDKPFSFAAIKGQVFFAAVSSTKGGASIDPVQEFIRAQMLGN
uniref:Signal recognition particle receptor subunit beta n=1 Tax=Polytomella parva TaxID=51329 RepID=A0A7S0YQY2_9CHLO|mmetsp:Transcript_5870/g.11227  ORF Transcript_5870/g.11227 Transcript_5870/m.11227 type:complete len:258 (+) Transcript_5870:1113-1886(+)|eukprot:CAMPEP_0175051958 /NCGR_PEP_ID=MMETSP0052_2-20121109/8095_1 /TAXON_ID=51329 ORGANISM="Polytomella parva, Strain SAG 63-3" /NCGR_SAMPLE_ID=MMETSP0052_2 /ASSEMBLY_ACC=CAM_ASM_000194 /LENGTH=257 /DNA_ID=CAMNT_0016316313 /DNA_START=486 /DNA_END=1259 /DNA_ORIENTATION=+